MNDKKLNLNSNKVIGIGTVILGILVILESMRIYQYALSFLTGDHIMPGFVGIIMMGLGIKLAFFSPDPTSKPSYPSGKILLRIGGTALLMVLYIIMMKQLGYLISTLAVSYGLFRVFGGYSRVKSGMMALILTGALYLVFIAWLNMPFPRGIFKYMNLPF